MVIYFLSAVLAKKHKSYHRQALDTKPFSVGYWEWWHRFLIDANKKDDYPTLFFIFSHGILQKHVTLIVHNLTLYGTTIRMYFFLLLTFLS